MQTAEVVQWDLVDYGAGKFHVASYQEVASGEVAAVAAESTPAPADTPAADESHPGAIPDCFFYRCWSALRAGCNSPA